MVADFAMFIHIGNNKIVSDKKTIGIFNRDTLLLSNDNEWMLTDLEGSDKTIVIDELNAVTSSKVSPYTVIKRTSLGEDCVWRRSNDKKLQRR